MTVWLNPFDSDQTELVPIGTAYSVTLGKMLDAGKAVDDSYTALPYIRAANIQDDGLRLTDVNEMPFSKSEAARLDLRRGDLLVVEGGAVGTSTILDDDMPGWSFQKTVNRVRPTGDWSTRYLGYVLRAYRDAGIIHLICNGSTISHLTAEKLRALRIPSACSGKQCAIADYLDHETARIDTLIEEQHRLIEMLRERRESIWAECVETARRLGRPATVRRVIESITDGPFGSSLTSAHYSDEGARVIRLGNIGINEFKGGDTAFISLDYAEKLHAHTVEKGDVVVAGLGDDRMPLGRAAVVPEVGPAIVKADCYRLRPNEQVTAAYLAWVMSAPQTRSQIMLLARGSTRARLNTKVVQQVEIPLPDRNTQNALVAQSAADTAKIDRLIADAERFVELSRERRSALITAAVTGQLNTREMV